MVFVGGRFELGALRSRPRCWWSPVRECDASSTVGSAQQSAVLSETDSLLGRKAVGGLKFGGGGN